MIFDESPGGPPGAGVSQTLPFSPFDRALHAQFELLDIEWLGDVIIGAQFESLQLVASLILLREKNYRNMTGAHIGAQGAAHLVAVDIRQHNVKDDQMRQDLLRPLQRI